MPFDLGAGVSAALAVALFGAAIVRGYSGFGFSAIFIAFAALITNPIPLIPVVFGCEILMTAFQARGIRGHIAWHPIFALLTGAAIVLPFSVAFILSIGPEAARFSVSLVILAMSLLLFSGWTLKRQIKAPGHFAVGMVSGLCNSAGVGGLPVATFLTAQPLPPAAFRATMIVYLTGLDLITFPLLWAGGLVSLDTAIALAIAFPILSLGVWLGGRQFLSAKPSTFRKFAVILLLGLSTIGLIRPMMGF